MIRCASSASEFMKKPPKVKKKVKQAMKSQPEDDMQESDVLSAMLEGVNTYVLKKAAKGPLVDKFRKAITAASTGAKEIKPVAPTNAQRIRAAMKANA